MYCPYCRTSIPDSASFCPTCGANLSDELEIEGMSEQDEQPSEAQAMGGIPHQYVTRQEGQHSGKDGKAPKQRSKVPKAALFAVIAVALIAIVVGIVVFSSSNGTESSDNSADTEQTAATDDESKNSSKQDNKEEDSTNDDTGAKKKKDDKADADATAEEQEPSTEVESADDEDGAKSTETQESAGTDDQTQETQTPQSDQAPDSNPNGTKSLEFRGVSCQIPEQWTTTDVGEGKQFAGPPENDRGIYVEHIPSEATDRIDLISLAANYALDDNNGEYQNLQIIGDPVQVSLDNGAYEGIRLESTGDQNGTAHHYLDQWVQTQHSIVLMRVTSTADTWDQANGELLAVLDSLHIENQEAPQGNDMQQALWQ